MADISETIVAAVVEDPPHTSEATAEEVDSEEAPQENKIPLLVYELNDLTLDSPMAQVVGRIKEINPDWKRTKHALMKWIRSTPKFMPGSTATVANFLETFKDKTAEETAEIGRGIGPIIAPRVIEIRDVLQAQFGIEEG